MYRPLLGESLALYAGPRDAPTGSRLRMKREVEDLMDMPAERSACSLQETISTDFHEEIKAHCERCETGTGDCLADLMLAARIGDC